MREEQEREVKASQKITYTGPTKPQRPKRASPLRDASCSFWALSLSIVAALWARPCFAQQHLPIDANALALVPGEGTFAAVRSPWPQTPVSLKARVGYLLRPLELRAAALETEPLVDPSLEHLVLLELFATMPLIAGLDVGLGLGAHVYQTGTGSDSISGQQGTLAPFSARDPRLELGWASAALPVAFRPFLAVVLPFGDGEAFAGERRTRVELGFSTGQSKQGKAGLSWAIEADLVLRAPVQTATLTWGTQARIAAALRLHVHPRISLGAEAFLAPILHPQPDARPPQTPGEALFRVHYQRPLWTIALGGGGGLPLSRSSLSGGLHRAPTSPVGRFFAEFVVLLDAPTKRIANNSLDQEGRPLP